MSKTQNFERLLHQLRLKVRLTVKDIVFLCLSFMWLYLWFILTVHAIKLNLPELGRREHFLKRASSTLYWTLCKHIGEARRLNETDVTN